MIIDWKSWDELRAEAWTVSHLDRETGTLRSRALLECEVGSDDALTSAPERYLPIVPTVVEGLHRMDRIEKACLQGITDPGLLRSALDARRAIGDLDRSAFASRAAYGAECDRRAAMLEALLAHAPAVAARWRTRSERIERHHLWTALRCAGVHVDNPPPWVDDLGALREEVERGWNVILLSRLEAIDAWLRAHAPRSHADLRPPASEAALDRLQAVLPPETLAIPGALRALYRWHDGMRREYPRPAMTSLIHNYALLSLEDVRGEHSCLTGMLKDGLFADRGPTWWNARWLPFLSNGSGDCWFVDLTPEHGGRVAQFFHDDPRREILFDDVDAFIEGYADALSAGMWRVDADDHGLEPLSFQAWKAHCMAFGGRGEVMAPQETGVFR